ncbi:transmembrane protein 182-like [Grus japonensis]|uniref:Transmembrane protein 182-like n=1 Tax=Grus japonensis TaxID=30415 RepID=A0ABC9XCJ7_GRUJA
MKAGVAALTAGILGGTGVLLFLIAFGTDYWLLATETCGVFEHGNSTLRTREAEMPTEVRKEILTFHHEGFFWRCWFFGKGHPETIWTFWYMYRGFWTAFIMLAVAAGLVGGLLLVCGVPFVSPRSYKVGGGFLLASGALFLLLIFLFVMWKEFAADFQKYILLERSEMCTDDVPVHVYYGWSFMFAAAGVPLALLSGLLFYLIGRDIMESLE